MNEGGESIQRLRPGTTRQLIFIIIMSVFACLWIAVGIALLSYNVSHFRAVGVVGSALAIAFGLFLAVMSIASVTIRVRYKRGRYGDEYDN